MEDKSLNFSSFFQNAIKKHSGLLQVDAINALLCGVAEDGTIERVINDSTASWYASGKRAIRKDILTKMLMLPNEEAVRRLRRLGFRDVQKVIDASEMLVREDIDLSDSTKKSLLSHETGIDAGYEFIAKVFLSAVNGPLKSKADSGGTSTQPRPSGGQSGQATGSSEGPNQVQCEDNVDMESESGVGEEEKDRANSGTSLYSQDAIEVSIFYRPLSMPEDKETVISEILSRSDNSFINIDRADAEVILSGVDGDEYFLVEMRGTRKSIIFALSKWADLLFCTGVLVQLEGSFQSFGLEEAADMMHDISCLVHTDATTIFGTKVNDKIGSNKILVHGIFRIHRNTEENNTTVGRSELDSESSKSNEKEKKKPVGVHVSEPVHFSKSSETEEKVDPYDEIFRIFNKK